MSCSVSEEFTRLVNVAAIFSPNTSSFDEELLPSHSSDCIVGGYSCSKVTCDWLGKTRKHNVIYMSLFTHAQ